MAGFGLGPRSRRSRAGLRPTRRQASWAAALAAGTVAALSVPVAASTAGRVEAESMHLAPDAGSVVRDTTASGKRALRLTGPGWASTSVRPGSPSRLVVSARAQPCAGAPHLTVAVDGRRVLSSRVDGGRWRTLTVPGTLGPGAHTVRLRLADPHESGSCTRAVSVDFLDIRPSSPARWVPGPRTTWQWQLTTPVDQSVKARMYDIDLFDNSAAVVASLHSRGRHVVCYFSAGTVEPGRPDTAAFPAAVIGKRVEGWPQERWLDIRRLDVLAPILERRLDLCKSKGFDGVEADNVDAYDNDSGFPLTGADQLRFNRFLASAAHARGLSIGLKNDLEQAAALEPSFDWALDEQCVQYHECDLLRPFVRAGKAVFEVEYELAPAAFCPRTRAAGLMSMQKHLRLDAWRRTCW